jgi:DNA-binding GntR family transcriptional regulator
MSAVTPAATTRSDSTKVDLTKTLRDAIVSGEYAPNQRLIEADLSASFGASRAAVRTALLELGAEGLVDRLPNRGSRVRAIPLAEAIEILEVRMNLEGLCAAKAATHITESEVTEFRALRADILSAAESDLFEYSRLNQQLDRRIREIAQHPTAVTILERLRAQGVRHQFRLAFYPGRAAVSAPEHAAIIDAIVTRDGARAEAETRAHLSSVIDALRAIG